VLDFSQDFDKSVTHRFEVGFTDHERRQQPHDVLPRCERQDPTLLKRIQAWTRGRSHLNADHQTDLANLPQPCWGSLAQAGSKRISVACGAGYDLPVAQGFERRDPGGASERVAAERGAVRSRVSTWRSWPRRLVSSTSTLRKRM